MTTLHAASREGATTVHGLATAANGLAVGLTALHKTYGATVAVDRVDLTVAVACAKGQVGAMLQSGGLPGETTVGELVHLMRALYPQALPGNEVLARAGIADLAGRRTNELSGGETQWVRFALALVPTRTSSSWTS
jgi:ABC-type multidrug transport system ATPase subunit